METLMIVLLIGSGVVVLFLAVRSLFLWYWKVDTIVANQEIQIALLKELLDEHKTIKPGAKVELKP
jgi:hypothetical protein